MQRLNLFKRETFPIEAADTLTKAGQEANREHREILSTLEKARLICEQDAEKKAELKASLFDQHTKSAQALVKKYPEQARLQRDITELENKINENIAAAEKIIHKISQESYKNDLLKHLEYAKQNPRFLAILDGAAWRNKHHAQAKSWGTCLAVLAAGVAVNALMALCRKNHSPVVHFPERDPLMNKLVEQLQAIHKHTEAAAEAYPQLVYKNAELRALPPIKDKTQSLSL